MVVGGKKCVVTCLFIVQKKIQKKRNIKSGKIDKKEKKNVYVQVHHNNIMLSYHSSFSQT